MKKLFALMAIFALVLAACGDGNSNTSTTLTINNMSSYRISNVEYSGIDFSTINSGKDTTKDVSHGTRYVLFNLQVYNVQLRCRITNVFTSEEGKNNELTITNNTIITTIEDEQTNSLANIFNALRMELQSTVVWWDDAGEEMKPYFERRNFAGYYDKYSLGDNANLYPPKNGDKSIAIGGTNDALLHIKINLDRKAKLSFWYANKNAGDLGAGLIINDSMKLILTTNVNWSFIEFNLEPGENNLVWGKRDGIWYNYYYNLATGKYENGYFYLTLDDILIYYTE
ncbi:MAG: hypothetical protein LBH43_03255 [Treponema sp.]|jgi:hypothetical protein|nr:hypothetical protein [Treponema sp.]